MNWETLLEWEEKEWNQLEAKRLHHPACKDKKPIPEGYSPRLTHSGARITWYSAKGLFGPQCRTGLVAPMGRGTRKEKAKVLAQAIGRMLSDLDDKEARSTLQAMSNEELANVIIGGGAQKLQGLRYLGELLNLGVGTPEVANPDDCPIGKGKMDCPVCGSRHQPAEIHVSDDLMHSLNQLTEIQHKPRFRQRGRKQ